VWTGRELNPNFLVDGKTCWSCDEFLKKVAPKLSLLDFSTDSILIRDRTATKDHLADKNT